MLGGGESRRVLACMEAAPKPPLAPAPDRAGRGPAAGRTGATPPACPLGLPPSFSRLMGRAGRGWGRPVSDSASAPPRLRAPRLVGGCPAPGTAAGPPSRAGAGLGPATRRGPKAFEAAATSANASPAGEGGGGNSGSAEAQVGAAAVRSRPRRG